jgi:hypothetical protein
MTKKMLERDRQIATTILALILATILFAIMVGCGSLHPYNSPRYTDGCWQRVTIDNVLLEVCAGDDLESTDLPIWIDLSRQTSEQVPDPGADPGISTSP